MTKEKLRNLWDAKEQLDAMLRSYDMRNAASLTADQRFELDLERHAVLVRWAKADRAYKDAAEEYAKSESAA